MQQVMKSLVAQLNCNCLRVCRNTQKSASRQTRAGFSLIEVTVVVAIIAVLYSTASGYYGDSLEDAQVVVVRNNLTAVKDAIARYFKEHMSYPSSLESLQGPYLQQPVTELLANKLPQDMQVYVEVPNNSFPPDTAVYHLSSSECTWVAYDFNGAGSGNRQIRNVRLDYTIVQSAPTPIIAPVSYTFASSWGSYGTGDGEITLCYGLVVDPSGNILITDTQTNRIQKFDSNGNYISQFNLVKKDEEGSAMPIALAIDSAGNILVSDGINNRIQKFDSAGNLLSEFGSAGTGDGQFDLPADIAIDSAGNIIVADAHNNRIQKFDSDGNFILSFGASGSGDGEFSEPVFLTLDQEGNILVSDGFNSRIQKFDSYGNFISKFGAPGTGDGEFNTVSGITVDPSGNIIVADFNNRIQVFDSNGNFIHKFGSPGSENGELNFPTGLALDSSGNLYVSDAMNHRIQKFTPVY